MYTAVIPVRKGSRRLKNKNILKFGDSNLLEYKVKQLLKVSLITNIVVSSDCAFMLSIADMCGVKKHKVAIDYLSLDQVSCVGGTWMTKSK